MCFNFLVYFFLFLTTRCLLTGLPCSRISSALFPAFTAFNMSLAWFLLFIIPH